MRTTLTATALLAAVPRVRLRGDTRSPRSRRGGAGPGDLARRRRQHGAARRRPALPRAQGLVRQRTARRQVLGRRAARPGRPGGALRHLEVRRIDPGADHGRVASSSVAGGAQARSDISTTRPKGGTFAALPGDDPEHVEVPHRGRRREAAVEVGQVDDGEALGARAATPPRASSSAGPKSRAAAPDDGHLAEEQLRREHRLVARHLGVGLEEADLVEALRRRDGRERAEEARQRRAPRSSTTCRRRRRGGPRARRGGRASRPRRATRRPRRRARSGGARGGGSSGRGATSMAMDRWSDRAPVGRRLDGRAAPAPRSTPASRRRSCRRRRPPPRAPPRGASSTAARARASPAGSALRPRRRRPRRARRRRSPSGAASSPGRSGSLALARVVALAVVLPREGAGDGRVGRRRRVGDVAPGVVGPRRPRASAA